MVQFKEKQIIYLKEKNTIADFKKKKFLTTSKTRKKLQ